MRAALLIASLAVLGFLALGLRQAEDERRGREAVLPQRSLTPAQEARAWRLTGRAGESYPGAEPEILRGILLLDLERPRDAERILLEVVAREPKNIEAWAWLGNAARDSGDRALAARARAAIDRLRPPVRGQP